MATKFQPQTWGRKSPKLTTAQYFFQMGGKKTPTKLGLGWFHIMTKPYVFFGGKLLATSGSCSVDLGPSWYQQFFSTISEDGAQRGAFADG